MSRTMLCTVTVSVLVKRCFYYTSTLAFLSLQVLNNFLKWIPVADPVSFFFFTVVASLVVSQCQWMYKI